MKKALKIIGIALLAIVLAAAIFLLGTYLYYTKVFESKDPTDSAPGFTGLMEVDGESLAYSEIDNDSFSTIVFVGGLAAWGGTWERTIDVIKNDPKFNYIALDLPPFGYSTPDLSRGFYRDEQAKRILAFIKAKNLSNVVIVSHSYGAGPSAEAVIADAGKTIKKFIVIDGVLNIDEPEKVQKANIMDIDWLRNLGASIALHSNGFVEDRFKGFVHITDNVNADLISVYTRAFDTKGTTARLSTWLKDYSNDPVSYASTKGESYRKLAIPVRVIWGDKDSLTSISLADKLTSNVPDVKLYALKDVGHIPMIEDYDQFDAALRKALDE